MTKKAQHILEKQALKLKTIESAATKAPSKVKNAVEKAFDMNKSKAERGPAIAKWQRASDQLASFQKELGIRRHK